MDTLSYFIICASQFFINLIPYALFISGCMDFNDSSNKSELVEVTKDVNDSNNKAELIEVTNLSQIDEASIKDLLY